MFMSTRASSCCASPVSKRFRFRGDADFTQSQHLDRWGDDKVLFVFRIDATPNLVDVAESLQNTGWERLTRPAKYKIRTEPRGKRKNVKEQIVLECGLGN
jgi:hypothetical protein